MSGPEVYVLGFPRPRVKERQSRDGTCGHLLVRYSRATVQRMALWSWISLSVFMRATGIPVDASPACSVG